MTSGTRTRRIIVGLGCAAAVSSCTTLNDPAVAGTWSSPERLVEPVQYARLDLGDSDLAVADPGDAVAIWRRGGGDVLASRYDYEGSAWSLAEKVNNTGADVLDPVSVSMDAVGSAIAVWAEEFEENFVLSNRATTDGVWRANASRIDDAAADVQVPDDDGPHVSMSTNGTATALWIQRTASSDEVWANHYAPANGWGKAVPVDSAESGAAASPAIAVDPNGNAVAVWTKAETGIHHVWTARYVVGEEWGDLEPIEGDDSADAEAPRVGASAQGDAVVVWRQGAAVWSNRLSSGSWLGAVRIDARIGDEMGDPDVAVYPDGRAVAVWSEASGGQVGVWCAQSDRNGGWDTPALLGSHDSAATAAPSVAASAGGVAIAVWRRSGTAGEAVEAAALVRGTWSDATPISPAEQVGLGDPRVAIDARGNAIALWTAGAGESRGVWVSHWSE